MLTQLIKSGTIEPRSAVAIISINMLLCQMPSGLRVLNLGFFGHVSQEPLNLLIHALCLILYLILMRTVDRNASIKGDFHLHGYPPDSPDPDD